MRPNNKIWIWAMVLIALTLLSSSSVEAGVFDSIGNLFGDVKDFFVDFWYNISDYVTSWTFWMNAGILVAISIVAVMFSKTISEKFEGAKQWFLYALLLIVSIVIAVQLGDTPIYSIDAVRWLLHWNILINLAVVFAVLKVILMYLPKEITDKLYDEKHKFIGFILPIVITLLIVYSAAGVQYGEPTNLNANGDPALIWNSQFWVNLEKYAFGDRVDPEKFGDWTGTYDIQEVNSGQITIKEDVKNRGRIVIKKGEVRDIIEVTQIRYGFLYWKPMPFLGGETIPWLNNWKAPPVPPLMIFIILWILLTLTLDRLGIFAQATQGAQGSGKIMRWVLYVYLAIVFTARGTSLADIATFARFYLFIVLLNFMSSIEGISIVTRFVAPYMLSEVLLGYIFQANLQPNFEWVWQLLAFEILVNFIQPIVQMIQIIFTFIAGLWGTIANITQVLIPDGQEVQIVEQRDAAGNVTGTQQVVVARPRMGMRILVGAILAVLAIFVIPNIVALMAPAMIGGIINGLMDTTRQIMGNIAPVAQQAQNAAENNANAAVPILGNAANLGGMFKAGGFAGIAILAGMALLFRVPFNISTFASYLMAYAPFALLFVPPDKWAQLFKSIGRLFARRARKDIENTNAMESRLGNNDNKFRKQKGGFDRGNRAIMNRIIEGIRRGRASGIITKVVEIDGKPSMTGANRRNELKRGLGSTGDRVQPLSAPRQQNPQLQKPSPAKVINNRDGGR